MKRLCACQQLILTEALAVSMLETMHAVSPPVQFSVNKAEDIVVVGYIPADAFKVYAANFEVRSNEHKYFQLIRGLSHGDHKHALMFFSITLTLLMWSAKTGSFN